MSSSSLPSGALSGRPLFRLLGVGLLGWLGATIAAVVWFFTTTPDAGLMAVAFPFYAWMIGYVPGGGLMVLYALVQVARRRLPAKLMVWAGLVYFLPLLILIGVANLFLYFQPSTVQHGDAPMMLAAFTGPVAFVLFLIGLALGFARRDQPLARTVRAMLLPPLAGVALSGTGFIVFMFTSDAWQHRNDLMFAVAHIEWRQPRGLVIEGTLSAYADATAGLHAFYQDGRGRGEPVNEIAFGGETQSELAWTHGTKALKAGETYPVRLVWHQLQTDSKGFDREVILRITNGAYNASPGLLKEFRLDLDSAAAAFIARN